MGAKIRSAQLMKVPYMLIVGDREMEDGTASLRCRDGRRQDGLSIDVFIADSLERIKKRAAGL